MIRQEAPGDGFDILLSLLDRLSYRASWSFRLARQLDRGQGSVGDTLIIIVQDENSVRPGELIGVQHFFPVPPAAYNERSWRWWLFQRIGEVEQHERMEFFKLDGKAVYPPAHGPGNDPYLILDYGSDEDRRMSFRGVLNPE